MPKALIPGEEIKQREREGEREGERKKEKKLKVKLQTADRPHKSGSSSETTDLPNLFFILLLLLRKLNHLVLGRD